MNPMNKLPISQKKLTMGLALVVFIIATIIVAIYLTNSPIDPINYQLRALKSDDLAKAYSYTSKEFQQATSLSAFETFVSRNPILKQAKIVVTDKAVNGNAALLKGNLYTADGATMPIEYHLMVEDDKWKILQIMINGDATNINEKAKSASSELNVYENTNSRYAISYPVNWDIDTSEEGTVIFSGPKGSPSYYSTVNVQTVLTKASGGEYKTIKHFMSDIKRQAIVQSPDAKVLETGTFSLKDAKGVNLKGTFMVFTYSYQNVLFKQWQVVVLRNDNQVFYAWAYTSPIEQYANDLPLAKRMLGSWSIY